MFHFTRLTTALVLALLVSTFNAGSAQTGCIIIETQETIDGAQMVKKTRVADGESVLTTLREMDLEDAENVDFLMISEDGTQIEVEGAEEAETLLLIRRAASGEEDETEARTRQIRIIKKTGGEAGVEWIEKQIHYSYSQGHDNERAYVGFYPDDHHDGAGVAIGRIIPGGGAKAAGMRGGDVITAINGELVDNTRELRAVLRPFQPGDVVEATYRRNGQSVTTDLTLNSHLDWSGRSYDRDPCQVFIGVQLSGTRIDGAIEGTPAEKAQLRRGDRILAMDGVAVSTFGELLHERNKHQPGDYFVLTYEREGEEYDVQAQFPACEEEKEPEVIVEETPTEAIEQPAETALPVDNTLELVRFQAYPNPTFGDLRIEFEAVAAPTTVQLIDAAGRVIFEDVQNRFDGYYNRALDLSSENSGVYLLRIVQEGKVYTEQVVLMARA